MVFVLLLACAPTASTPDAPDVADVPEGADLGIPDLASEPLTPDWAPEEAIAAIEAALAGSFPSPLRVRGALNDWFRHGDGGCPGPGTFMSGPSFEGCTSEEGWYYLGVGGYSETFADDEAGPFVELNMMGDLTMVAPLGETIDVGGHWIIRLREGPASWSAVLNGSWHEPMSDADWLATGISAWLNYDGTDGLDGRRAALEGALTLRGTTLVFHAVSLGADGCGSVPTGEVDVRDPGGGTWSVDFGDTCTPCGVVRFEGLPVETDACLALDGLVDRLVEASTP
ncbi:MAG: hypothetical protein Q8P18_19225 [Pseudomonadota bacterium]|nr:hypothetical protein [Pseudomonadota bacterium]